MIQSNALPDKYSRWSCISVIRFGCSSVFSGWIRIIYVSSLLSGTTNTVPYGAIRVLSGGRFWKTSFFGNVIRYYQNNLLHLFSKNSRGLFSSFLIPFHSICIKSLVKMFLSLVISKLTGFLFFRKLVNLLFFSYFCIGMNAKKV